MSITVKEINDRLKNNKLNSKTYKVLIALTDFLLDPVEFVLNQKQSNLPDNSNNHSIIKNESLNTIPTNNNLTSNKITNIKYEVEKTMKFQNNEHITNKINSTPKNIENIKNNPNNQSMNKIPLNKTISSEKTIDTKDSINNKDTYNDQIPKATMNNIVSHNQSSLKDPNNKIVNKLSPSLIIIKSNSTEFYEYLIKNIKCTNKSIILTGIKKTQLLIYNIHYKN
jgi:hypothetical protein